MPIGMNKVSRSSKKPSVIPDSQVQRSADDSINSRSDLLGPIFNPNVYISGLKAEISSNTSGVSTAYITDNNENVLGSTDISGLSSGDSFRLEDLTLSSGTKYYLLLDNNGSTFTAGFLDNAPIPYETDAFDITGQYGPDFGENTVSFPVVNNIRNLDF